MFDLYLITDPDAPLGVVEATRRALAAAPPGRIAVQLRAKDLSPEERLELGRALRAITSAAAAPLLVNTDPHLAHHLRADGLHLPQRVSKGTRPKETNGLLVSKGTHPKETNGLLGVSCHDLAGVRAASGASFVVLSPFAETPGKGAPLGAAAFAAIAREAPVPVFALGGIDASNAGEAVRAGAAGVAVIRSVYRAADPGEAVRAILASLDTARAPAR